MIEIINHVLGLCGEHSHPNVVASIVGGIPGISYIYWRLKLRKSENIKKNYRNN